MKPEHHPLAPFLPQSAESIILGSFPPKRERWAMEFFYPNFQNDMWRIFGLIFFADKNHFIDAERKTFRKKEIEEFLIKKRIAIYDTAKSVIRHKDNASDKDLEVVEATDIEEFIRELPQLRNIIATGQKALDIIIEQFVAKNILIQPPAVGKYAVFNVENRELRLYRMPSSSRAYPLALEKKAAAYGKVFCEKH
jgi:G:T/U-mismatch repair DNA glycosylase